MVREHQAYRRPHQGDLMRDEDTGLAYLYGFGEAPFDDIEIATEDPGPVNHNRPQWTIDPLLLFVIVIVILAGTGAGILWGVYQ